MIQVRKNEILAVRDEVRLDAIKMLTRSINNALADWHQGEREGKKIDGVAVTIPSILEGNLPEELRQELEEAGYKMDVQNGILNIS